MVKSKSKKVKKKPGASNEDMVGKNDDLPTIK